jgi:hypothetical protein
VFFVCVWGGGGADGAPQPSLHLGGEHWGGGSGVESRPAVVAAVVVVVVVVAAAVSSSAFLVLLNREHNAIADELARLYPDQFPTDELLYQQARLITIGACVCVGGGGGRGGRG